MRALDAQKEDRREERQTFQTTIGRVLFVGTILILLIALGIGWALWLNKEQFVIDSLYVVGYFLAGGATGYSARAIKEKGQESDE